MGGTMKTMGALLFLGCLSGCGSDGDALSGTNWILDQGASCSVGISFGDSGGYATLYACDLTDGSVGMEEEIGVYEIQGAYVSLSPRKATCPSAAREMLDPFSLSGDTLTLQTAGSVLVFARNNASGGTGSASLGCFDGQGVFTPMPLVDL